MRVVGGAFGDWGPIWRSTRRQRAFALLVLEVGVNFVVLANLIVLGQWFIGRARFPTGHREADLVEVRVRRPATTATAHAEELALLRALPGVEGVAAVSSVQSDDEWMPPDVFWGDVDGSEGDAAPGPSACPGVDRAANGRVVGWAVEVGRDFPELVDLRFVEGRSFAAAGRGPSTGPPRVGAIVSRCLAQALFGPSPAVGRMLHSTRAPSTPIVGVVDDVRMHVPFLYQTQVTAFFPGEADDGRKVRYLVRTAPGEAAGVQRAAVASLARLVPVGGLVTVRPFASGGTRVIEDADGTVKIFVVVGGAIALGALLGNITVAAFAVAVRRRVIGIRRALGATRWDIFRQLWIEAMIPTLMGCALGLGLMALLLVQARALFPGLHLELVDVVATTLALWLTAVPTRILPAVRSSRLSPVEAGRTL